MFTSESGLGRAILGSTLLTVGALTMLSLSATHYLATANFGADGVNAAQRVALGRQDPETTGSIRTKANASRLDPCAVAARFPANP